MGAVKRIKEEDEACRLIIKLFMISCESISSLFTASDRVIHTYSATRHINAEPAGERPTPYDP